MDGLEHVELQLSCNHGQTRSVIIANLLFYLLRRDCYTVVPVVHTDAAVSALRAAGNADVRLTRYKTAPPCKTKARDLPGHGSDQLAYATAELWEWLLSHQRPPG